MDIHHDSSDNEEDGDDRWRANIREAVNSTYRILPQLNPKQMKLKTKVETTIDPGSSEASGIMEGIGVNCFVLLYETAEERVKLEKSAAAAVSYENALKSLLIDPDKRVVIYEKFDENLSQWISRSRVLIDYTPCDQKGMQYYFVSEPVKIFIRDLVKLTSQIHKDGYCCSKEFFQAHNFVIVGGVIKCRTLTLREYSDKRVDRDFRRLRRLIKTTFFNNDLGDVPCDMTSYLDLLPRAREKPYLVNYHFALMSTASRQNFMEALWQSTKNYTYDSKEFQLFEEACEFFKDVDWHQEVASDQILYAILTHGNNDPEVNYTLTDWTNFPRFLRNAVVHLIDHAFEEDAQTNSVTRWFTVDEVGQLIYCTFPDYIAGFQEALSDSGYLQLINLEDYFLR